MKTWEVSYRRGIGHTIWRIRVKADSLDHARALAAQQLGQRGRVLISDPVRSIEITGVVLL